MSLALHPQIASQAPQHLTLDKELEQPDYAFVFHAKNHSVTSAVHCAVALFKPGIPATVLSDTSLVFVNKNVWN